MARSFRVVARRLVPGYGRCKRALVQVSILASFILAGFILAGCGGDGQSNTSAGRMVSGPGFAFAAPDGWTIKRAPGSVSAVKGDELVEVATFPLQKRYDAKLFGAVATELAARMGTLARASGGKVAPGDPVTVAGIRSHSYSVESGDMVDRYVFVLRGKREYQLLCRHKASGSDEACKALLASFRVS
jgi:hypothetical protein